MRMGQRGAAENKNEIALHKGAVPQFDTVRLQASNLHREADSLEDTTIQEFI